MSIVAVALGGFGLGGALVAFAWWLARWAKSEVKRANSEADRKRQLEIHNDELRDGIKSRDLVIEQTKEGLAREVRARKLVEETLDDAIEEMAKNGNMHSVAAGIRARLERLRAFHEEMQGVRPSPSGEGGDGQRDVHGPIGDRD